jgi:uncharacterized sulfatase
MQFNGYKKQQYPLWTLAPLLNDAGLLSNAQLKFLAPCRPYEEFYDLASDPHELDNRADDTEIQNDFAFLSDSLDAWIDNYGDQGAIPENPAVVAEEAREMHTSHIKRMKAKGLNADVNDEELIAWWESQLLNKSGS